MIQVTKVMSKSFVTVRLYSPGCGLGTHGLAEYYYGVIPRSAVKLSHLEFDIL